MRMNDYDNYFQTHTAARLLPHAEKVSLSLIQCALYITNSLCAVTCLNDHIDQKGPNKIVDHLHIEDVDTC